ncbi:MAG: S-layer homology domain-containing protein [Oscillospiraceae bacterium]|jgi:hypothetical protein|nr:S-layer homology domain-containing protein [Oscillospiraceae bacterium]
MKRLLKNLTAALAAAALFFALAVSAAAYEYTYTFPDTDISDWSKPAIEFCYVLRVVNGSDDGKFLPKKVMTRAEFVSILYNIQGMPAVSGNMPFTDVPQWAQKQVLWAAQNGLVAGTGANTFSPGDPVTTEQSMLILYKYAKNVLKIVNDKDYESVDINYFSDAAAFHLGWTGMTQSVKYCRGIGLFTGDGNRNVGPTDGLLRERIAQIVKNFMTHRGITREFTDPYLLAAVKAQLNIPKNDWVFYSDVVNVQTLNMPNAGIQELFGLCYFPSLQKLYLGGNPRIKSDTMLKLGVVNNSLAQKTR